jgi:hypothetical protein
MSEISLEETCADLTELQARFAGGETIALGVLDTVEAEVRHARVPGFQLAARSRDELFFTFAGYGLYFRFAYTPAEQFVQYGTWATVQEGFRVYYPRGEWPISGDTVAGRGLDDLRAPFYLAVRETVRLTGGADRWLRTARHNLRELVDQSPSSEAEAGP